MRRDYEKDLPLTSGFAPKLQQVFMNLILNARDTTPCREALEITTKSDIVSAYVSRKQKTTCL